MNINFYDSNFNRLLDAYNLKVPDRVPILEFWPQSKNIIEYVIERPLGYEIEPAARGETSSVKIEDILEFAQRIGMDAVGADFVYWPGQKFAMSRDGNLHYVGGLIKSSNDLDKLEKPDNFNQLMDRFEYYLECAQGSGIGVYPRTNAFFNPTYLAMGLLDFSLALYDNLEFVNYLLDYFLEEQLKVMEKVCSHKQVKFIQIDDDVAIGTGLLVKKDLFIDLYFDRMKKLLEPAKRNNIVVAYHTDGKLDDLLPILIELGINAIHPVEPMSNDIYKVKKQYGNQICLCGNIDLSLLTNGSKEEIEQDVIKHIDNLKQGGGYVCGSSSSLYEGIPPQNYAVIVDCVHKHGYY